MTWSLGPTTNVVEAIDSHGKPFNVGPPPWMSQADLADEIGEDAEPHWLDRSPQSRARLPVCPRCNLSTHLGECDCEDWQRHVDAVPARAHLELEPAMPAWLRTFNWWPFFALLSLIFGAVGAWHLWLVLR